MFLNKHKAREQDLLMCGIYNNNKLPPATERHRPPESSNRSCNKSTKIGLFTNKTRIYSDIETSSKEGLDLGKLSKLWEKLATCEAKLEMMGRMMKENIGFNEIEDFVNKIERKITERESNRGGTRRSWRLVKTTMTMKITDERKKHSKLLKEKNAAKRMVIENSGETEKR